MAMGGDGYRTRVDLSVLFFIFKGHEVDCTSNRNRLCQLRPLPMAPLDDGRPVRRPTSPVDLADDTFDYNCLSRSCPTQRRPRSSDSICWTSGRGRWGPRPDTWARLDGAPYSTMPRRPLPLPLPSATENSKSYYRLMNYYYCYLCLTSCCWRCCWRCWFVVRTTTRIDYCLDH